ncbi:hypothetical protein [Kaarinaea lacus]
MDSDRLKMERYKDVLYIEKRMNDEFTLDDLNVIREEIRNNFSYPVDIICKRVGSYSVSLGTQSVVRKGIEEYRNFVYVVDSKLKRQSANYAALSYMKSYNTQVAKSVKEAYEKLKKISESLRS